LFRRLAQALQPGLLDGVDLGADQREAVQVATDLGQGQRRDRLALR
jgi:hypothetical protein